MSASAKPPSTRQVFLGLFIVGQLLFLFLRNGAELISDRVSPGAERLAPGWREDHGGHLNKLVDTIDSVTKTYAQATEQLQSWSLFSPGISRECVFPALQLLWDDEPGPALEHPFARLGASDPLQVLGLTAALEKKPVPPKVMPRAPQVFLSDNEPADVTSYLRIGNYRLRKYECTLVLTLNHGWKWNAENKEWETEADSDAHERWAREIGEHLDSYGDIILVYMRWRLDQVMKQAQLKEMPAQVVLLQRRFQIIDRGAPPFWLAPFAVPAPPFLDGPFAVPLARWRPNAPVEAGYSPLEGYDPVTESYRARRK